MATENKTNEAADTRPVPSQAEGDDPPKSGGGTRPVPSQAEGEDPDEKKQGQK